MRKITLHPEACAEVERARVWYEARSPNLGSEFVAEFERAIEATRAVEDERFDSHVGIDPWAVMRAAWQNGG